ncbi:MAG: hydroxyethylthiazole kinase [Gammaproteobacteria bacterium]|nr:hydroxyethylthiazole kinase [Gammaproteobacteria bacterium]
MIERTTVIDGLYQDLVTIRAHAPLVHNITNLVVMSQTANALLALGASPVMAHAEEEIMEMVRIAGATVINMGTLDAQCVQRMYLALKAAKVCHVPCVFDPVGAGATPYRTQVAQALIAAGTPMVIRGNASEIMALANNECGTKGVDTLFESDNALEAARTIVRQTDHVVVISGEKDFILTKEQEIMIRNGVPMMTKVVGLGCTATALIGAFCAINPNKSMASVHAMTTLAVAGELASEKSAGPGSFQYQLLDALYNLTFEQLAGRANITFSAAVNFVV